MACNKTASGIAKVVAYKEDGACWGDLPLTNTGGKIVRRVSAAFNETRETYQSDELRTDYQVVDFRHGVRQCEGSISGELSAGSYADFQAAALARDFTPLTVSIAGTIATAANVAPAVGYTLTAATDNFVTLGIKGGMVIRLGGSLHADNKNRNLLVIGVTATILTVIPLDGGTLTVQAATSGGTVTVPGKYTFAPDTNHTNKSFTFEEWYSDIEQSEVYTGNRVNTISFSMPASGLVTTEVGFIGKSLAKTGVTQWFSSPNAAPATGIFASVSGALIVNGKPVALLTSVNININRNLSGEAVVGSNTKPNVDVGRIVIDGDFSTMYTGGDFREYYRQEQDVSLIIALTDGTAGTANFLSIVLPRIKIGTDTKDDGEKGIMAQNSFQALKGSGAGNFVASTIMIQDSSL